MSEKPNGRRGGGSIEWTAANKVTVARIVLIPVFLVLLLAPWAEALFDETTARNVQPVAAVLVFALISLTDGIDGYLARSRNEVTVFGKFMDPIADKVLVVSALVALVEQGLVWSWVPIVIVARELLVSGLRMLVASSGVVIAASMIGKAKTFTTMVAIMLCTVQGIPLLEAAQPWFSYVASAFVLAAVVLTVWSMVDYFEKSWPVLAGGGSAAQRVSEKPAMPSQDMPTEKAAPAIPVEAHQPLADAAVAQLVAKGLTAGTAESCTGGLVAAALTSVPGSSDAVEGGVVSYAVRVKCSVLGVSPDTVERCGVVSEETAREMALGARDRLGVDYALSTTGVAGPGGGSESAPVGTVCFALVGPHGVSSETVRFDGDRPSVRSQAVNHALSMLLDDLRRSKA